MAIPFPGPGFIPNPPYTIPAFTPVYGHYSSAFAWRQTPAPTNCVWWDPVALVAHVASITSNDGKSSLVINSAGASKTFNIAGDGTAMIPVGIVASP